MNPASAAVERGRLLHPGTWPVRWRLALASAALTLAILMTFAGLIGHLATQRIRGDFNRELHDAATTLSRQIQIVNTPSGPIPVKGPGLDDFVLPNDASVRIFDAGGHFITDSTGAEKLGPPHLGTTDVGSLRVTTELIHNPQTGAVTGFVQYGRSTDEVDSTIERLWLFIVAGVLGGTLLATLAGLAIANRAMRPIASLTSTARKIATTRDPSQRMPQPKVEDEVGELARTLDQMLRSLDSARAEREGAMQKQREFVADASHELRTPLTSVIANLELLQNSLQAEQSEDREMVDSALRSSRRMSRLVADLLLLARADAGRFGERKRCDIAEIAGNAAVEVAPVAGDRRLSVENGRPMEVDGNPDELHRMVLNLLDNAVRHTPDGASIELRLERDDERREARIVVADDGPGIPAEQRDLVFDRFVRGAGPADTMVGRGTGLGLAIVRAVARSHGGDVEAEESPRGGAQFRVHLPLASSEETITSSLRSL